MSDFVSVCSECHRPLVPVEHGEGLVTFECPDHHGQRAFHLDGGQVGVPVRGARYWASVWGRALVRTLVQTSWLWGALLLDQLGHHRAAAWIVAAAAGWFARLLWEHYLEFRVWRAKFIEWRRERLRDAP